MNNAPLELAAMAGLLFAQALLFWWARVALRNHERPFGGVVLLFVLVLTVCWGCQQTRIGNG